MKGVIQLSAESFAEHPPPHPGSHSPSVSVVIRRNKKAVGEGMNQKKPKKTGRLAGWLDARQEGVGGRAAVKLDGVSTSPRTLCFHSAHCCSVTSATYNRVQQCDGLFQGEAVCTVISI